MKRIVLIALMSMLVCGCGNKYRTVEQSIYQNEDIWACDTRKDPGCMENIYHFGYKRDGTFYVWRKDDMMPSTICVPGERKR